MSPNWIHHGYPGHFCGAADCRFKLCTEVSTGLRTFLISTVGDYHPSFRRAYERSAEAAEEIGCGRLYETMVFDVTNSPRCAAQECGCNMPNLVGVWEEDCLAANTPGDAAKNHWKACADYAAM